MEIGLNAPTLFVRSSSPSFWARELGELFGGGGGTQFEGFCCVFKFSFLNQSRLAGDREKVDEEEEEEEAASRDAGSFSNFVRAGGERKRGPSHQDAGQALGRVQALIISSGASHFGERPRVAL